MALDGTTPKFGIAQCPSCLSLWREKTEHLDQYHAFKFIPREYGQYFYFKVYLSLLHRGTDAARLQPAQLSVLLRLGFGVRFTRTATGKHFVYP